MRQVVLEVRFVNMCMKAAGDKRGSRMRRMLLERQPATQIRLAVAEIHDFVDAFYVIHGHSFVDAFYVIHGHSFVNRGSSSHVA
jgi:hypothetical protein